MPAVFDIEQALLLLELEAPFDQRSVHRGRRRLAKQWAPAPAPAGRQHEHQRHLQAVNRAADELESLAESFRGGRVSANAVKASAAAARKARAEEGQRAYEEEQRAREAAADRSRNDPFGDRVPDHSVVHRYARCVSYPEWGVGTVAGIYFTGSDDDPQQRARVRFAAAVRTVSAWERLGRLRRAQLDGPGAIPPLERARLIEPSLEGLLDLALAHHLAGDVGTEVSVCEEAIRLAPRWGPAWARFAHALARTDRVAEGIDACERALELGDDAEVAELLADLRERAPRVLPHRSAA